MAKRNILKRLWSKGMDLEMKFIENGYGVFRKSLREKLLTRVLSATAFLGR